MGYLRASFWDIAGLAYFCGVGSAGQDRAGSLCVLLVQDSGGHGTVAFSPLCCTLFQNQVPSEGDTSPRVWGTGPSGGGKSTSAVFCSVC